MEFNKQLIWLWTHCRAIGMVHLSNMVGERKGIGSKGMELDIALFTIELVAENVALKKQLSGGLHPPTAPCCSVEDSHISETETSA